MGGICSKRSGGRHTQQLPRAHGGEPVWALVSAGGQQVATGGGDRSVALWGAVSGAVVQHWRGAHAKEPARLAHVPGETSLLASGGRDGSVKLWREGEPAAVAGMDAHRIAVSGLAALPSQRWLLSGSRDYSVRLWDLTTAQQVGQHSIQRNVVTFMRAMPDEPAVAQASEDLHLYVWDARTVKPAQTLAGMEHIPHCVDCSPDGTLLLTCHNGFNGDGCEVVVWDRRQGRALHRMAGHTQSVTACVFLQGEGEGSPGLLAVSASKDSTLRVWDATAGVCLATQPYSGGQCSAMDLLGRDAGGRPDTGSEATWRVPGHKGTFARLLCTADMQGSTALWGLRSLEATGSGAQLQQLASS